MIGCFGDIIFETTDKRIMNFKDFTRSVSGKWVEHSMYKRKARSEFIGTELDEMSFTIVLKSSLGVNPRKQIAKWEKIVRNGIHDVMVIGEKQIGLNEIKVTSISEAWGTIYNNGSLISANIDITFSEYVEEG
jgi:phage protein U